MNRCPFCFKPLPSNGICDCHYEESVFFSSLEVLRPGSVVGASYQIGRVLGQGGFGITYQGFDLDLEKIVAIKEFYPKGLVIRTGAVGSTQNRHDASSSMVVALNTDSNNVYEKSLNSFFKEAKALGRMSDIPNVVQVHRIFRENGTAYIVMDFVEGKSLKQLVRERGPIPERILLPMLDPVVESMGKVHDLGILHRDIAPDNIILNKNGQAVLLDFGASKLDSFQDAPSNQNSLIVQKKGYSPVEQLNGKAEKRSDIYAMGATYYSLLTGKVPQDTVERMMNDEVRPLKELGISERVSDAVQKAMEIRKENRWDNMYAFRDALNGTSEWQSGYRTSGWGEVPEPAVPVEHASQAVPRSESKDGRTEPDNSVPEPKKKKSKKGPVWAVVLAVLAAAAAAAYFFILPKWDGNPFSSLMNKDAVLTATADGDIIYPPVSPVPTKTSRPTATKTPVPTKTNLPTATKTPVPTKTPSPTATKTPVPTKTPLPTATRTPVPTKTPLPTATRTPVPTKTPLPTATKTPVPTSTTRPTAVPLPLGSSSPAAGDRVYFGRYEQDNDLFNGTEPIEWQVLAVEDGKALLLSRYALDVMPFHDSYNGVTWRTSRIRTWLKQNFLWKAFSADERNSIVTVTNTTEPNPYYSNSVGGPDTDDKIFLLSYREVQDYLNSDDLRECKPTDYTAARGALVDSDNGNVFWWLRTPGSTSLLVQHSDDYANERMSRIGSDGSFLKSGAVITVEDTAVRPAIWVSTASDEVADAAETPVPTGTSRPTATKTPVPSVPTATPKPYGSSSLAVGDRVYFGRYEQDNNFQNLTEPIEWQVLAVEDGKALLLSRYALDVVSFNDSYDGVTWRTSRIRTWLKQNFFWKAFSADEKNSVVTVTNTTGPNPQDQNSVGGPDTDDKIFLLSYEEVQKYLPTNSSRACEPTEYTAARSAYVTEYNNGRSTTWWLRTPGNGQIKVKYSDEYANERMACIGSDGSFMATGVFITDEDTAVRPAIWVITGGN